MRFCQYHVEKPQQCGKGFTALPSSSYSSFEKHSFTYLSLHMNVMCGCILYVLNLIMNAEVFGSLLHNMHFYKQWSTYNYREGYIISELNICCSAS